jgi:hypothetical protein
MPHIDNETNDVVYETFNEERISSRGGNGKNRRRRFYPSNKPQSLVVNAQTGIPYSFHVGSNEQQRLFKTVDATGLCDEEGYVIPANHKDFFPITHHLFYDTPEQCMSHLRVSFERSFIEQWHEARRTEMSL